MNPIRRIEAEISIWDHHDALAWCQEKQRRGYRCSLLGPEWPGRPWKCLAVWDGPASQPEKDCRP
jgi:hypothetical protein